jgi:hypothetical protein
MSAFMAMNVGTMALVAQSRGACQKEEAEKFLRQGLLLSLFLGVVASVLGTFFAGDMIRLMGAGDAETIAGGTAYLKIQMMGIFGIALTMTVSAALRGVGETKITMLYNLVNNIVNVIFNYFLIFGNCGFPRLGVAGASLATVLGQFVAFGMAFGVVLRGKRYLHLRFTDSFVPDFRAFGRIFNIGLPAVVEQLAMRFGIIAYTRTVASLGTVPSPRINRHQCAGPVLHERAGVLDCGDGPCGPKPGQTQTGYGPSLHAAHAARRADYGVRDCRHADSFRTPDRRMLQRRRRNCPDGRDGARHHRTDSADAVLTADFTARFAARETRAPRR